MRTSKATIIELDDGDELVVRDNGGRELKIVADAGSDDYDARLRLETRDITWIVDGDFDEDIWSQVMKEGKIKLVSEAGIELHIV